MENRLAAIEKKLDQILSILNEKDSVAKIKKNKRVSKETPKVTKSGNAMIKVYNDIIIVSGIQQ